MLKPKMAMKEVIELIEQVTDQKRMSKEEYAEFLEELTEDLDLRLHAVRDELDAEGD